jgi:hypothetical protein
MADLRGRDGFDGADAYELAVASGFKGTQQQWLASLRGERGEKGERGETGARGADAPPPDFEALARAAAELVPPPRDGERGPRGPRGERGPAGKDAALPPAVAWGADITHDSQGLVLDMVVTCSDPKRTGYRVIPVRDPATKLMTHADLIPLS